MHPLRKRCERRPIGAPHCSSPIPRRPARNGPNVYIESMPVTTSVHLASSRRVSLSLRYRLMLREAESGRYRSRYFRDVGEMHAPGCSLISGRRFRISADNRAAPSKIFYILRQLTVPLIVSARCKIIVNAGYVTFSVPGLKERFYRAIVLDIRSFFLFFFFLNYRVNYPLKQLRY